MWNRFTEVETNPECTDPIFSLKNKREILLKEMDVSNPNNRLRHISYAADNYYFKHIKLTKNQDL